MADTAFDTFIICFRMIQSYASVFLNLLTLICVVKYKSLRNSAGVLVASLALTDTVQSLALNTLPIRNHNRSLCASSLAAEAFAGRALPKRRETPATAGARRRRFLVRPCLLLYPLSPSRLAPDTALPSPRNGTLGFHQAAQVWKLVHTSVVWLGRGPHPCQWYRILSA